MKRQKINIAGGGIAGLATALALGKAGHDVVVHEKEATAAQTGAGLQLGPNAVRALRALGAWEAVSEFATSPEAIELRDGVTGTLLRRIALGKIFERRFGEPYRVIHRADLHQALFQGASAVADIRLGTKAKLTAETWIAADGVRSPMRFELFGAKRLSHYATFFRTILPVVNAENIVSVTLFPGAHVVSYPVGNPRVMNIVVAVDHVTKHEKNWATQAIAHDVTKHLQGRAEILGMLDKAEQWTSWSVVTAPPLTTWHKGNACLIGDAAHGCLPYLAQGAAMALEDAVAICQAFQGRNAHDAFIVFQQQRKTRTEKIARVSAQQGRTYHASGLMRLARNQVLRHLPDALLMQRLGWIYRYDE